MRSDGYYASGRYDRLHRAVYVAANGPVPRGFHVHHVDGDKANNDPANLALMSQADHVRHHATGRLHGHGQRAMASATMADLWAKQVAAVVACAMCGCEFESRAMNKPRQFCGSKCLEAFRIVPFDPVTASCARCGAAFTATRSTQKFCSRSCNARVNGNKVKNANRPTRAVECASCGTTFTTKRANATFCGRACAVAFHSKAGSRKRRKASDARPGV